MSVRHHIDMLSLRVMVSCKQMRGRVVRYAIYFVPEETDPLRTFGAQVLGYDLVSGLDVPCLLLAADLPSADFSAPAHYGFHATLKAPFRLAAKFAQEDLLAATQALAARLSVINIGRMEVRRIKSFLALAPAAPPEALNEFAMTCVRELDHFRAPASQQELDRRRSAKLSPRHEELMLRWGYPYVEDQFRFHMTLTGSLDDVASLKLAAILRARYEAISAPIQIQSICLCVEKTPTHRFTLLRRYQVGTQPGS